MADSHFIYSQLNFHLNDKLLIAGSWLYCTWVMLFCFTQKHWEFEMNHLMER
jgi:hypothetical protein